MAKRKKRRVSNCKKTIAGVKCPGKYLLTYEESAPIFTCESCGDKELTWQKFYNDYLQLFKQKDNWDIKKHQVSCVIGFFCYLYKKKYNVDYVFVPKNPNPYSAKECRDTWAMLATFKGNAHEARKYIYWFFNKHLGSSTNITSFGYLNTPGIIRRYNIYVEKKKTFTRSSRLPKEYTEWCQEQVPDIFDKYELGTMNDLGALLSHVKTYSDEIDSESSEFRAVSHAVKMKLIQDDKLNIRG